MSEFLHYINADGAVVVHLDLRRYGPRFKKAQQWYADRILEDCRALMPLDTGSLQQRSHTTQDWTQVVFPGPYAGYLYRGKVMVDSESGKGPRKIPTGPGEYILRFRKGAKLVPTDRSLNYSRPEAVPEWFEKAKEQHGEFWRKGVAEKLRGE